MRVASVTGVRVRLCDGTRYARGAARLLKQPEDHEPPDGCYRSPLSPCPLLPFVFAFLRRSAESDFPTSSDSLNRPLAPRRTYRLSVPLSINSRLAAVLRFV